MHFRRPLSVRPFRRPSQGLLLPAGQLHLPGVVLAALLLAGCGGADAPQGDGTSAVERFLQEAEATAGETASAADLSQPPVPGWTMLEPPCPFLLRLQVPPGWGVVEGSGRTNHLELQRGGVTGLAIMISMVGGDAAVGDRIREAETHDPSVVRAAEVRYGRITVPVHVGAGSDRVRAYPAVDDWGVALQMAVVDLQPAWDRDAEPMLDQETLVRIATTLEPNGC